MALELTNVVYTVGLRGDNSSEVEQVCDIAEWPAFVNAYLGQTDPAYPNLACRSVRVSPLRGSDLNNNKVLLTMSYAPKLSIDAMTIDMPFKWRQEVGSECVTIHGGYYWQNNGDDKTKGDAFLNRRILPVKRFALVNLVLYGTRSTYDLSTYLDTIDHVNSDTFLGAPPETVFFESATSEMKLLLDGTTVYAVELHMKYKPSGWNKFFREDGLSAAMLAAGSTVTADHFYRLIDDNNEPVYPLADFAGLLL